VVDHAGLMDSMCKMQLETAEREGSSSREKVEDWGKPEQQGLCD
jgi:hypothetical protein